jgi:hypothetical protein
MWRQNNKTNEFFTHISRKPINISAALQMYPLVPSDALIKIALAAISAVWSLDQHLSEIIQFPVTMLSNISAAIELVFLICCGMYHFLELSGAGQVSCRNLVLCPEILVEVDVLLSYSTLYC